MRVLRRTDEQLILGGVPGGRRWMVVLVVFGLAASAAAGFFAKVTYDEAGGLSLAHLPLAFGRLRLDLNLATGRGEYQVRSPIIEAGKSANFDLKHVDSVSLERSTEWRPGREDGPETEATVWRARLRLTKPRRAIVLDETENNRLERVEAVAQEVADFLGKPLERDE